MKYQISLHANGIPPAKCPAFAKVRNAAMNAGLTEQQAVAIAKLAYNAGAGFVWNIPALAVGLAIITNGRFAKTALPVS